MATATDLTGQKFNRLTVIRRGEDYISNTGRKCAQWLCKCDCKIDNPNLVTIRTSYLKSGHTKSCGCLAKEKTIKRFKKYNRYDLTGEYGIGYTSKGEEFYFDLEDYDKIKNYCWYLRDNGKIINKGKTALYMHRLIMDCPSNMVVDHIYHVLNDNRKSQLRIVTLSQNSMNVIIRSNNTSGTTGVSFNTRSLRWDARIEIKGKMIKESFKNKDDAIKYRKMLEKKYQGEYAYKENQQLNNINEELLKQSVIQIM